MLYSIIGILVIIFDQLVKYWVDEHINYLNPSVDLIPNVLSLVRVQNDGAAFSFLQGGGARIWFIALTAVFALLVVLALATNFISGRFGRWCLVFITAGGLSNMIDRVRFGYVIDMFKFELFDFAVFNVADIFITVFCIAFILYILFGGEKEPPAAASMPTTRKRKFPPVDPAGPAKLLLFRRKKRKNTLHLLPAEAVKLLTRNLSLPERTARVGNPQGMTMKCLRRCSAPKLPLLRLPPVKPRPRPPLKSPFRVDLSSSLPVPLLLRLNPLQPRELPHGVRQHLPSQQPTAAIPLPNGKRQMPGSTLPAALPLKRIFRNPLSMSLRRKLLILQRLPPGSLLFPNP